MKTEREVQDLLHELQERSLEKIDQLIGKLIETTKKRCEEFKLEFIENFSKQLSSMWKLVTNDLEGVLQDIKDQLKTKFEQLEEFISYTKLHKFNLVFTSYDPILALPDIQTLNQFNQEEVAILQNMDQEERNLKPEPLICHICQKVFQFPSRLRKHYAAIHKIKKVASCPNCEIRYNHPALLVRHLYAFHSVNYNGKQKAFKCQFTGKVIRKLNFLFEHIQHDDNYTAYERIG